MTSCCQSTNDFSLLAVAAAGRAPKYPSLPRAGASTTNRLEEELAKPDEMWLARVTDANSLAAANFPAAANAPVAAALTAAAPTVAPSANTSANSYTPRQAPAERSFSAD